MKCQYAFVNCRRGSYTSLRACTSVKGSVSHPGFSGTLRAHGILLGVLQKSGTLNVEPFCSASIFCRKSHILHTYLGAEVWRLVSSAWHVSCGHHSAAKPLQDKCLCLRPHCDTALQKLCGAVGWLMRYIPLMWQISSWTGSFSSSPTGKVVGINGRTVVWPGVSILVALWKSVRCTLSLKVSWRKSRTSFAVCGLAPSHINDCVCIGIPVAGSCTM